MQPTPLDKEITNLMYMIFVVATTIMLIYVTIATMKASKPQDEEEAEIVTILKCSKCGYTQKRKFEEGDYIGKVVDAKCPKCGGQLIIESIHAEKPTELPSTKLLQRRKTQKKKGGEAL